MKIENIYIGGWFQRTMLQLTEIYDFLRKCESRLKLDKAKLKKLHDALEIENVDYATAGLEYLIFETKPGISIKIYEDGLIILNDKKSTKDTLFDDLKGLETYYEKNYHQL